MRPKIAIFYHMLLFHGDPPEFKIGAYNIVSEQMDQLRESGLLDECEQMIVGCNGGEESKEVARLVIPPKAKMVYHGLKSKAENLTIIEIERWAPLHLDWLVLYKHSKGATHEPDSHYGKNVSAPWRRAMMEDLVMNWRQCVADLESGADVACSHFMRGLADGTQNIAAGNFWWAKASFLANLPSMWLRERIKQSGISAAESRFESEVWLGNGKMPRVMEYRPNGGGGVP